MANSFDSVETPAGCFTFRVAFYFLLGLVLLHILFFSAVGVQRYENLETGGDFAFFVQVLWNHQHGIFYYTTLEDGGRNALGTHVDLITLPLALILWPFPLAYGMIVLQAVFCCGTAVILYLIAEKRGLPPWPCFWAGMSWLIAPHIQGALVFDFHSITVAPFFFFWGVLFYESKRRVWASVLFGLAVSCREEVALLVAFFGLIEWIRGQHRRFGAGLLLVSLVYFVIAYKWIMPWALQGKPATFSAAFVELDRHPVRWALGVLSHPSRLLELLPLHKVYNYIHFLVSFSFLPFLGGWSTLLLIPPFGIQLVSTSSLMTGLYSSLPTQYGISPMVGVAYAGIEGLNWMYEKSRRLGKGTVWAICAVIFICSVIHASLCGYYRPDQLLSPFQWQRLLARDNRARTLRQIIGTIDPSVSIVTTRQMKPHLATRARIWEWVVHGRSFFPESLEVADRIAVDVQYLRNHDMQGLLELIDCLQNKPFGVTLFENEFVLAERGFSTERNATVVSAIQVGLGTSSSERFILSQTAEILWILDCDSLEGWSPQPAVYLDTVNACEGSACISRKTDTDNLERNFWYDGPLTLETPDEVACDLCLALRSENWELTHIPSIALAVSRSFYVWREPPAESGNIRALSGNWNILSLPLFKAQKSLKPPGAHTLEIKILNPQKVPPTAILVSVDAVFLQTGVPAEGK
ncbi:MAG TPA: DUF2079 domain-containing protein [bacterium]|nr:DUF2079 domain-containing protein [bacterium]HQL63748.1 DUF2079 domain-containing protein [bacterium]